MARTKRLTPRMLKNLVLRERRRMMEALETGGENVEKVAAQTQEVGPNELADSIENDVDWLKALKIKEARAIRVLRKINETRQRVKRRMIRKLK